VKHWQETARILERAVRLSQAGQDAALATVVHIAGSAYRRPGAKLLVEPDGRMTGSVSGGCLEADVREVALAVLQEDTPRLLHYDTGDDEQVVWGLGLGCNGTTEILVQPLTGAALEASRIVRELLDGETPFAVSTVVAGPSGAGQALVLGSDGRLLKTSGDAALDRELAAAAAQHLTEQESKLHQAHGAQVFTEVFVPPPHLVVCGAGDDTLPLAGLAAQVGFRVTVVDHRPAYLTAERFPEARLHRARPEDGTAGLPIGPNTLVVVKMHSLAQDREWLQNFLATEVSYVGVLGPRARTDKMLAEIGTEKLERVFGPVGLDLGAEGPEQVALSIVAELLAVWSAREPRHLREKRASIHA
jgi:xanthine/CO dehydrogenase XdhC/CoxF family maturation factor